MNELELRVADEIRRRGPVPFSEVMDLALVRPGARLLRRRRRGRPARRLPHVARGRAPVRRRRRPCARRVVAGTGRARSVRRHRGRRRRGHACHRRAGRADPRARLRCATCSSSGRPRFARAKRDHLSLEDPALAFAPDRAEDEDGDVHPPRSGDRSDRRRASTHCRGCTDPPMRASPTSCSTTWPSTFSNDVTADGSRCGLLSTATSWSSSSVPADGPDLDAPEGGAGAGPGGCRPLGAGRARSAEPWSRSTTPTRPPRWRAVPGRMAAHLPRPPTRRTLRSAHLGSAGHHVRGCVDQLPTPSLVASQADWLRAHGIDDLVEEGKRDVGGAQGTSATLRRCAPAAASMKPALLAGPRRPRRVSAVLEGGEGSASDEPTSRTATRRDVTRSGETCPLRGSSVYTGCRPSSNARIASGRFSVKPSMSWLRSSISMADSRLVVSRFTQRMSFVMVTP